MPVLDLVLKVATLKLDTSLKIYVITGSFRETALSVSLEPFPRTYSIIPPPISNFMIMDVITSVILT